MHDVISEVKSLLTEKHEFRTLMIDPITPIYNDLLEKCEARVGNDFGRHYGAANKEMKRLANLIMALDMNVVITAHAKTEYGENLRKLGYTFDGWRQLDYWFDLVIELGKRPAAPAQTRRGGGTTICAPGRWAGFNLEGDMQCLHVMRKQPGPAI